MFDFSRFKKFDNINLIKDEILLICKNSENGTNTNYICDHIQKLYPFKFTRLEIEDVLIALINQNKIIRDKDWKNNNPLSISE